MDSIFPFDGRADVIVAADTSLDLVVVPEDRIFLIKRFHATNHNGAAARVRFWDSFTDSSGNVHDAVTNPILLADFQLLAGEGVEVPSEGGLAKAIGTVIARSTVGAADPNDVVVGAWGTFEA